MPSGPGRRPAGPAARPGAEPVKDPALRDDEAPMRRALRDERGMTGLGLAAGVVAAAALIAVPLVLMARTQQERTEGAVGALGEAEGVAADATLNLAVGAAGSYFAERGGYAGFGPEAAAAIEPGVRWNASLTAVPGEVSVRAVTSDSLVLVTADGTGAPACAALRGGTAVFGRQDAATSEACLPAP